MQRPANNFDAIRLLAAFAVLWDHQHALMGLPGPKAWQNSYGGLAVAVFFAISGYLVMKSWRSDPHVLRFAWRRALRIWPGLTVAVLLCTFVLGPLVSDLSAGDFLRHPQTWAYLQTLWMQVQFVLPGVFAQNLSHSVNGSLWTIPIEVGCYALLAALGLAKIWRYTLSSAIFLILSAGYLVHQYTPTANAMPDWSYSLQYTVVFAIGMTLASFEALWLNKPRLALGVIGAGLLGLAQLNPVLSGQAPVWALGCTAVVLGTCSWPILREAGRFGDCSYGTYIYAFPVQQTVLWTLAGTANFWLATLASVLLTLALALASWHFIEKPALRFKPPAATARPTLSGKNT